MKSIKFKEHLVKSILKGEKKSTWRLFDDKNLQLGDNFSLINSDNGLEFAQAKIVDVVEKSLGNLNDNDWEGHERYDSNEEMYEVFSKYYPEKEINYKTIVKIIKFKLMILGEGGNIS